jgi:single-stranded-DNA-specific exonuclease
VLVVGSPHYNLGVLGLASGRLAEKYDRLVFVWSKTENGEIKGSCRSPHNINVVELMKNCGNIFVDFGGHAKAGGFSLRPEFLDKFETLLVEALAKLPIVETDETVEVDGILGLSEVTFENVKILNNLSPFGKDNPKPVFWFKNLEVNKVRTFGNSKVHLELSFLNEDRELKAIGFFSCPPNFDDEDFDPKDGHHFPEVVLAPGRHINLLANLEISTFGFRPELRLRIVDILPAN